MENDKNKKHSGEANKRNLKDYTPEELKGVRNIEDQPLMKGKNENAHVPGVPDEKLSGTENQKNKKS